MADARAAAEADAGERRISPDSELCSGSGEMRKWSMFDGEVATGEGEEELEAAVVGDAAAAAAVATANKS